MKICLNGSFVDANKAKISVLDNGLQFGDGVYDTMRAYNGKILELDLHVDRIFHSVKMIGIGMPWTKAEIREWIQKLVTVNKFNKARVRITVTRGVHGFEFTTFKKPTLIIAGEKLIVDEKIYTEGVTMRTMHMQRILPDIKTVGLTSMIVAYRKAAKDKTYEMLFIGANDMVREGASTSFFMVKDGILYTPKSEILDGLTRKRVIILAKKARIKVVERDFPKSFLKSGTEMFLTNRPREIIPVIKLDGKKVGNGKVGPVTKQIMELYQTYVKESITKQ